MTTGEPPQSETQGERLGATRSGTRRERIRSRRRWRRAAFVAVPIAVVLLVLGALLGLEARKAQRSLTLASADVSALKAEILTGDAAARAERVAGLQAHTADAVAVTTGSLWSAAAATPLIGPTFEAVQTVSAVIDDLAREALPRLAAATSAVDPASIAPRDGRIELQPIIDVAPEVMAADAAVQEAAARLDGIDTSWLLWLVSGPVRDARAQVSDLAMTTATASRAVQLLPPMLGSEGPRRYLLLVQTNAEVRSSGGVAGAVVVLTADQGTIEFVRQASGGDVQFDEPVLPLTEEELALYTERLGNDMRNINLTPDFPRTGELAKKMWADFWQRDVDGVFAADPVALQYMLGASGPVTTESGLTLTGDDAAQYLLNTVYLTIEDNYEADAVFAEASESVVGALTSGVGDPGKMVNALARAAGEGRLLAWSAHPQEQELLAPTVLGGRLEGEHDGAPVVGVYLNDGTFGKMSYYLDYSVQAQRTECRRDGQSLLVVTVDLASTAPADAAGLPWYINGGGRLVPPGVIRTNVAVYSPTGGQIGQALVDGEPAGLAAFEHAGQAVGMRTVELAPGESQTIEVEVLTGTGQPGAVQLRVTPGARTPGFAVLDAKCGT